MTRRHVLTQMERLADRLQADHSPYTPEDANRLRELRGTLSVLEGPVRTSMSPAEKRYFNRLHFNAL